MCNKQLLHNISFLFQRWNYFSNKISHLVTTGLQVSKLLIGWHVLLHILLPWSCFCYCQVSISKETMKVIHCFKGLPTPIQHRTYSTGLYKLVYKRASCFKVQWKGEVNWSHINTPLAPVFISLSIPTYLYRSHLIEKPKYYKHCLNFPPFFLPYTKGI